MLWLHVGVFVLSESARVLNLLSQKFFLIAYLDIIFFPFFKKIIISPSVWKCTIPHLVLVNWWREAFKGHASNNLPSPGKKMPSEYRGIFFNCPGLSCFTQPLFSCQCLSLFLLIYSVSPIYGLLISCSCFLTSPSVLHLNSFGCHRLLHQWKTSYHPFSVF